MKGFLLGAQTKKLKRSLRQSLKMTVTEIFTPFSRDSKHPAGGFFDVVLAKHSVDKLAVGFGTGTLRTNPLRKAKDVFCRLHLPTFLYRSEAENFGDLMHAVMDTNKGVNKSVLSLVKRS